MITPVLTLRLADSVFGAVDFSSPEKVATAADSRPEEIERLGRRCRQGDAAAWESLFPLVWPVLVAFVHRLYHSLDQQDAEVVAQASLEAAVKNIRTFSGRGLFRGWLFGIAAKQAATLHRARSAAKRGSGLAMPLHESAESRDESKSPADLSAAQDRAAVLHRAIDALDEVERDLVHLHFFGELTYKEIAEARRMNAKTVSTRLRRCKAKLLTLLLRSNLRDSDG